MGWQGDYMRTEIALLVLTAVVSVSAGLGDETKQPGIGAASCSPLILVEVNLYAGDKPVFVPSCGKGNFLCTGMMHLEVETPEGWREPKLRFKNIVLGRVLKDKVDLVVIAPHHGMDFEAGFSPEVWAIDRGQRLRLVVDTWGDEQSMRNGEQSRQLISPVFECPLQYKP
jgi:hypothetical protein